MNEVVGIRGPSRFRVVLVSAVILVVAGIVATIFNGWAQQEHITQETTEQAQILAATAAPDLDFANTPFDRAAVDIRTQTQAYVEALRNNPQIVAAGVYDAHGDLTASFAEAPLPKRFARPSQTGFVHGQVVVVAQAWHNRQHVGDVIIYTARETLAQQLSRYGYVGLLVLLSGIAVFVLGVSQGDLTRANRELKRRAADLSEANEELQVQMAEREKAEAALRQSQKMEAIGRLTGGVAHDFNNLLMVASSGLELMDRTEDPARRQMLKEGVLSAVKRGADLTRQLLAFARKNPLKPEVIDPGARIEGLRLLVERSLTAGVVLELELEPDLWPVEIDAGQLDVALLNIAVNARDAMPDGGRLTIRAENLENVRDAGLAGDYVRISATDTGSGIPKELIASVIEPFFTTKGVGKGTGLGLSQVYGFCRSSGGDIRIESEMGVGTTVRLYVPRSSKPLAAKAVPPPPRAPSRRAGRVLLVEDDSEVAAVVAGMFQSLGWDAQRVADGPSALAKLDSGQPFDLMFSDMVMPGGVGGLDLAQEAAKRRPGLKIILTTGFSEAAAAAAEQGMRVLPKPYDLAALTAELEYVLQPAPVDAARPKARRKG
jgi:signal transduction histidine kinase/ActR/RegA family two-component response regulator